METTKSNSANGHAEQKTADSELQDFANLDYERGQRCGFPEVVYGQGKTAEQVVAIATALANRHAVAFVTRSNAEQAKALQEAAPDAQFLPSCGILYIDRRDPSLAISGGSCAQILENPGEKDKCWSARPAPAICR